MGFLDQSTNNIIVDAVLTDTGRQFLARNDGSFSIVRFGFFDDEVDYSIIEQFGRTVGKEKIIKNTPVMEAQTHGNLAAKHKLIGISNPGLIRLPSFDLNATADQLSMTRGQIVSANQKEVILEQVIKNENVVDPELRDETFIVTCNNSFIRVSKGGTLLPWQSLSTDGVATYICSRDRSSTSKFGARLTLQFQTRAITDNQFRIFGNYSNKDMITTFVTYTGVFSGAQKTLEIQITKN